MNKCSVLYENLVIAAFSTCLFSQLGMRKLQLVTTNIVIY